MDFNRIKTQMFPVIWNFVVKALPSSYSQLNETTSTKTTVFCKMIFFLPFLSTECTLRILYEKIDFSSTPKIMTLMQSQFYATINALYVASRIKYYSGDLRWCPVVCRSFSNLPSNSRLTSVCFSFYFFCHLSCTFALLWSIWFTNTVITFTLCNIRCGCLSRTKDNFYLPGTYSLNMTKVFLHQSFTDNGWQY